MTAAEFFSLYYRLPVEPGDLCNPDAVVEHVTLANADSSTDGKKWRANSGWQKFAGAEDFHSSDRARALLEVGYWGTLDVESVS